MLAERQRILGSRLIDDIRGHAVMPSLPNVPSCSNAIELKHPVVGYFGLRWTYLSLFLIICPKYDVGGIVQPYAV